jgi:hypothetical protein
MSLVLNVEILGEFKRLTSATQGAQTSLAKLSDKVTKFGSIMTRTIGALGITLGFRAIVEGAKDSVIAASDLEQQFGALDSVFKANAPEMKAFAKDMNKIGLSSAEAARQSVLLGSMIKGAGFNVQDAGKKTQDLVKLAGDLAATFGGPTSDAVRAISALLRNEYDPIERYGVSIKKSDINARLAAEGLGKLEGEARKQAEVQAGLALLFEKTADAQGQAARESDTYAGKTAELQAKMTDLSAQIGEFLLPILIEIGDWLIEVLPDIQNFLKNMKDAFDNPDVKRAFGELESSLGDLGDSLGELFGITATPEANGFVSFFIVLAGILDAIVTAVDLLVTTFKNAFPVFQTFSNLVNGIASAIITISGYQPPQVPASGGTAGRSNSPRSSGPSSVTINVNKGNVTAKEIAKAINKDRKVTGSPSVNSSVVRPV